jgi:hypothetical protein
MYGWVYYDDAGKGEWGYRGRTSFFGEAKLKICCWKRPVKINLT